MAYNAPGKHFRKGLSVKGFFALFPDDETAEQWFIGRRWPNGIACPYCESDNVNTKSKHKSMPFRCRKKQGWRVWQRLQREDQHVHGFVKHRIPELAVCSLPPLDKP